ncbi:MAG: hypothetical protein AB1689_16400, partial [Thermodesulfobacteriota bacterium]
DGTLRYKRKWGAVAGRPVTWDYFLLQQAGTAGARAALTAAPLVVQRDGELLGLLGAEGVDPYARAEALDTAGLSGITVLGADGPSAPPARRRDVIPLVEVVS